MSLKQGNFSFRARTAQNWLRMGKYGTYLELNASQEAPKHCPTLDSLTQCFASAHLRSPPVRLRLRLQFGSPPIWFASNSVCHHIPQKNDPFSTPVCSPNSPDLEGVKAPPRSISNFTSFPQTFTTPLSRHSSLPRKQLAQEIWFHCWREISDGYGGEPNWRRNRRRTGGDLK